MSCPGGALACFLALMAPFGPLYFAQETSQTPALVMSALTDCEVTTSCESSARGSGAFVDRSKAQRSEP
jgi:hypothetical protein